MLPKVLLLYMQKCREILSYHSATLLSTCISFEQKPQNSFYYNLLIHEQKFIIKPKYKITTMKALIIATDEFEDLELFYPYYRLKEEDIEVHIASNKKVIVGKHGYKIKADFLFKEVDPRDYDILLIPGGKSPERIRIIKEVIDIVNHFIRENKIIAAICHGPQVLISAGAVKNRKITSWIGIRDDLINAGAEYIDKEVVVDKNIITSRMPSDLPAFCKEILNKIKGRRE